ncbi:MAG TPA: acetate--CoA ligase family protein [Ktedonobacterales bacterium]|nr:acetate--CoA ligase family protein [Ktedonobacterales bacterium]
MVVSTRSTSAALWTDSQLAAIHAMLHPRSIAVIGATARQQYGGRFLTAALRAKDRIRVYPVNPNYDELGGVACYPSVEALPETPDLAGVVVPASQVLGVLEACHRKGVRSAIVISAGFAERGTAEGRALENRLTAFAHETGLRISGPNCLGVANLKDDIWPMASSSTAAAAGATSAVGLVCQSGATAFGPLQTRAADAGIGYTYIISTGNEADLDFTDYARYLIDDPETKVIAGFIEGLKSAEKLVALAILAAQCGKPIVVIKIGRSEAGARAAGSHTGALTGSDARFDALCAQYGVLRVQDYDELLEVSQLLAQGKRTDRTGIAVVSHSGGVSSLTADMLGAAGLQLPPLSDHVQSELNTIIKGFGWASNPADLTGYLMRDDFPRIVQAMIDEPDVGTLVVASAGSEARAGEAIQLREHTDKNLVYMWTGARSDTRALPILKAAGVPIFYSPASLARGLRSLYAYHAWRDVRLQGGFAAAPPATPQQLRALAALQTSTQSALSESESKRLVGAWGIPITREVLARSSDEAIAAAETLGYPVALKVDSPDILHKTEAGVVRLGLADAAQVRNGYADVMARAAVSAPRARINGVLVQEMVTNGLEVIVGVNFDVQLGPMLLFGIGGVLVEVYQDVALRRCPIDLGEAWAMVEEVKGARLLKGYRGGVPVDRAALAQTLVAVSHMGVHLHGAVSDLDINPLMVLPEGQGVKAADALVLLKSEPV